MVGRLRCRRHNIPTIAVLFLVASLIFLSGCTEGNNFEFISGDLYSASIVVNGQPITRGRIEEVIRNYEAFMQDWEASLVPREINYLDVRESVEKFLEEWGLEFSEYEIAEYINARMERYIQQAYVEVEWNTEAFQNQPTLGEAIFSFIRDEVVQQEARRRRLRPLQEVIDIYMNGILQMFEDGYGYELISQIGMELTKEEFLLQQEEFAYYMALRSALWEPVMEAQRSEIQAEADRRDVIFADVAHEFYIRFAEELVAQAAIEILDPEVAELLGGLIN